VYAYVSQCLRSEAIRVSALAPFDLYSYWSTVLSSQKIHKTLYPSNLLNPVTPVLNIPPIGEKLIKSLANLNNCKRLFKLLWTRECEDYYTSTSNFTAEMSQQISAILNPYLANDIKHRNEFNAIHLRRGDKVHNKKPEAKIVPLFKYVISANSFFDAKLPILIFSDSPSEAHELKSQLESDGFCAHYTQARNAAYSHTGYDQRSFNRLHAYSKIAAAKSFLNEFSQMVASNHLLCTFSSCVGRTAYMLRAPNTTTSLDTKFSIVQ
jgi:hypothetical protein